MPRNIYDPADKPMVNALSDAVCPKCSAEMEPIDNTIEDLPLRHLQLCPECYLLTYLDASGFQIRQGVPVKKAEPSGWSGKPN